MLSDAASDEVAALVRSGEALSNDELISIVNSARLPSWNGIDADIFTYNGRTLVLAYAAAPMRDRFSAGMRFMRSRSKR